jgi:RIO kinase 1
LASSLEHLEAEGVISEIIGRLKSGKEADVYVVRYGGELVAAKVYKDRAQRSFKNNAAYKEGRSVRSSRSQRAIDRGSKFGKEAAEDAWKAAEAATLYKLHSAGVRVPTPVVFLEGVLFMELVLGADGAAAPRLMDMDISAAQANAAYMDMLSQLARILSCDLIHGDLSPYNVLWSVRGPTIIDFPQVVSASHNSNSEAFFLRDARNILGHLAAIDPRLRARHGDAREIWRAYMRRELTPDFLPSGRPPATESRARVVEQRPRTSPNHGDGRAPLGRPHQNGGRPRVPENPNDGRGSRGPQNQNDGRFRTENDGRAAQRNGDRSTKADHFRPSGGPRHKPAPEVIVMARRPGNSLPAADRPNPVAVRDAGRPQSEDHDRSRRRR